MKILYLCADAGVPVLGHKGASVHVRQLVAAFTRAGHRVILAAHRLTKSPWEKAEEVAATLLHLRPGIHAQAAVGAAKDFCEKLGVRSSLAGELRRILYNQELELELQRRFENEPPDFIYERASLDCIAGVLLAQALQVPLVLELNAPLADEQGAYRGRGLEELALQAERWVVQRADAVLAVSAKLREHVLTLGALPERVHVIANAVDPTLFAPGPPDPDLRAHWALEGHPVLGFVGGLRPWHGVEVLPALLEQLSREHKDLRLVIVGDGQLRSQLEEQFAARNLGQRVLFTGALAHEAVAAVIRLFDVALAPYPQLDHAFYFSPLKLFEYMACGVPVVAARVGQIAEVVEDDETGLLYPPGDGKALAAACERLLLNPKLRLTLGQAAAKAVRSQHTWDHNASRVTELAQDLIAARGRPEGGTG